MLRSLAILLLTCLALLLPSCITAEEKDFVTYDAAKDEFHMLMVLSDIQVKDADDLDFLAAVHANRDHLIAPILPGGANLYPMLAFSALRTGDKQYFGFNLYSSRPDSFRPDDIQTSLKDIKITPGTFFLQGKSLGYYQAVTVPGKTIDGVLDEISAATGDALSKSVDTELERRANGGVTHTWAEYKDLTIKQMTLGPAAAGAAAEPSIDPMTVVDTDSLKKIKAALADKSLKLTRDKTAIVLTLPLVAKDAEETVDLIKKISKRLDELVKETKPTPENADQIALAQGIQSAMTTLTLTPNDKGLTASIDILKFAAVSAASPPHRIDMNGKPDAPAPGQPAPEKVVPPDVVAFLKDKKIPIDDHLTAAQILKDFNAGTLKAYPSETPVTPGEGIIKPPAPPANPDGMH